LTLVNVHCIALVSRCRPKGAIMANVFSQHNLHKEDFDFFNQADPQLRALSRCPLVYNTPDLNKIDVSVPGIYTLTGGRQIGKTTALKLWMKDIIGKNHPAESISFFAGEMIDDHHALVRILLNDLQEETKAGFNRILILDEVTYIQGWDKGIKFLADSGNLENVVLVLTGSDSVIIQEARSRFPGRRGEADVVDHHMNPLSFRQVVHLRNPQTGEFLDSKQNSQSTLPQPILDQLEALFTDYTKHGGFLTAMNDLVSHGEIKQATMSTYADWVRGDVLKRNKSETRLREVLQAVLARLAGQITWNNLAADLTIDHPATVASYIELLASLDVIFIQPALLENKLSAAPKKPKKLHFRDPFICRAIHGWLKSENSHVPTINEATLVEGIVATHISRLFPTFYIKAAGEVDVAFVRNKGFEPLEVKWGNQTRPKDLKQISKYKNALIWRKQKIESVVGGASCHFLPLALYRFMRDNKTMT